MRDDKWLDDLPQDDYDLEFCEIINANGVTSRDIDLDITARVANDYAAHLAAWDANLHAQIERIENA